MKIIREWPGWKLFFHEEGKYLLVRYDDRLLEFKTLQIILPAVDDASAVNQSEVQMKTFEKRIHRSATLINRLR